MNEPVKSESAIEQDSLVATAIIYESPLSSPLKFLKQVEIIKAKAIEDLFQEIDKNGDNLVSKIELINALKQKPEVAEVHFYYIVYYEL